VSDSPRPAQQRRRLLACAAEAEDTAVQLKLQLETVRFRTSRLREELQAADRQARLSHQLTLLGQFTAGFMHEFNNPLAIVAGRLEVLLDERKDDVALCADLEQMLKEARYMSRIATTLLQALRRERGGEVFDASIPQKALEDALAALRPVAQGQSVRLVEEISEVPRVDLPEHVVGEVVRCLLTNALQALKGEEIPRLCRGGSSSLTFTGVHPRNSKREPTKAHAKEKLDGPIGESKPHGMGVQIPRGIYSEMPPQGSV
jgi:signal transduction histidine kinase